MTDPRFVVSTFRIPKKIHAKAKEYTKEFNRTRKWDTQKLSLTVLIGSALDAYMKIHPLIDKDRKVVIPRITREELLNLEDASGPSNPCT